MHKNSTSNKLTSDYANLSKTLILQKNRASSAEPRSVSRIFRRTRIHAKRDSSRAGRFLHRDCPLSTSRGFTLLEILISAMILTIGIMAVSQLTITSQQANRTIKQHMEGREALARGIEVLKLLPADDPLLSRTCTPTQLNNTALAHQSDTSNLVGQTIGATVYDIYWNVADSFPSRDYKTIRMIVLNNENQRLIDADFVKWKQ